MATEVYKLVTLNELKDHLDIDHTDTSMDGLLTDLRDAVEALLESSTNQEFSPPVYGLEETHDGTGTPTIYTRRPIADITDITLTYGPLDAITTLSITDVAKFRVGHRRIKAIMYTFPEGVNNVVITYDTVANQPPLAKAAVKEVCATLWGRRGSEDARSEDLGTFSHVALRDLKECLLWSKALDALTVFPMG